MVLSIFTIGMGVSMALFFHSLSNKNVARSVWYACMYNTALIGAAIEVLKIGT